MTITDIVSRIYKLTKTNASSYLAADMLIDINVAYRDVVASIMDADGRWPAVVRLCFLQDGERGRKAAQGSR